MGEGVLHDKVANHRLESGFLEQIDQACRNYAVVALVNSVGDHFVADYQG